LDHSKQTLDFCVAALAALDRINSEEDTSLNFRVGVAAGPLCSAVVGSRQFHYEIWGHAADQAARMRFAAKPGEILVSDIVRQKVDTQYAFVAADHLSMDEGDIALFRVDTSATARTAKELT
jgi:class 3 adenylate cyclase